MNNRDLIKALEGAGFELKRVGKGSHHIFFNPETKVSITVPIHGMSGEQKPGMLNSILKKAGLK